MAKVTPPYYFEEFLLPARRREPTPRERELGFTVKDLEWLYTLYYPSDEARKDSTVRGHCMLVERLQVNLIGKPAVPLAGAFMMSPTPDDAKAVLYTPYGGLELFDSHTALLDEVRRRLRHPSQRTQWLQFQSIDERIALPAGARLAVTTATILGPVMEDLEQGILAGQQKNLSVMFDELRKLPSLNEMLDSLLGIMARSYFPGLDQTSTRVDTFRRAWNGEVSHPVASESLRDTLLRFYARQAWPMDQTHTFFNPAHDTRGLSPEQLAQDQQRWDSVVEQTSGALSKLFNSLLQTYWNEDFKAGQSRLQFFAQTLRDTFRADLLFKHQQGIVSAEESRKLRAVMLPDQRARTAANHELSVERVRVETTFQHHVDLAGTLMISNSHAYLYTQSRGLQVLTGLKDLNDTLLTMLKTAGYEDELLNVLSLDERSVFVGMDQIQVSGKPVTGDVFQEMLEGIVAKQSDNLEHALGLYRRSAGAVDLGALLDRSLDIRSMLDSRLLARDTDGRWSVHPITSSNGRPTTVQAEKAKQHLQQLQAVEAAMALERNTHPVFAPSNLPMLPKQLLENNQVHRSLGMLQGLSGEAQLRRLQKKLRPTALTLLDSVLHADGMTRQTRHGLNGFIPDAFGLTLKIGATLHALAHCFVLTERGGTDPAHSGAAVLWTPRCGYEAFASIKVLREALEQRLQDPLQRLPLMENLPVSKRKPHQHCQLGPLQRIDSHLLNDRQQSYSDFTVDEINYLLSMQLNAQRFAQRMDSLIRRPPPTNLPRATAIARAIIHQQALPVWLGMAAPDEQILQAELLEQYRISALDERDYLHSITTLREYAASSLSGLLHARFPGHVVNPDNVLIPGRINLTGNTLSLTDFALRHLPELRAEDLRPHSRTATPLPDALDGTAVMQMVRQLDLKSFYQTQLTTHLKGNTEDTRERRRLFCRLLPWQLLQYAHQQKLEDQLSASAWSLIQQVFDMPDGVARAAVEGATAAIRPLELIATPGAAPANALGCYVIGPPPGACGPVILYAPYSPEHFLVEYANEAALLHALTAAGALQDWVTGQMQAPNGATYRNLLRQSNVGASEIRLGASTVVGNLLKRLFEDNIEMLLQMLACQFDPSGQARWNAATRLFTQGISNGLQCMAGKLAYPLAVWRSYKLFKTSAEDLQQHRWQHALKTFISGVAELAAVCKALDRLLPTAASPQEQVTLEEWLNNPQPAAATLADVKLTAPERTTLRLFEDHEVALADLSQGTSTQPYRDSTGTRHFVPLAGKVYPVKKVGEHWRLSQGESHGPYVQRTAQGGWALDLDRHNPRYGKTLSRFAGKVYTRAAEREVINIEAVGMREIAALSSWKAQCIDEALNVATYYAVTCKRNLRNFAALREPNSRLGRFFTELFGVFTLTADQVQKVERRVDEILDELTNHTLIGPDSQRFVSGTHRYNAQDSFAFVIPDDLDNKIYLLDRFFDPGMDVYQNRLTTPFNISAHARAASLLHEISHIKSLTEDLAYLDTMRPFHDLININIQGAGLMRTDLADLRATALSTLTPATLLFKAWDEFSQAWEDFGSHRVTSPLKDKVLNTTGARTLDEARAIFMSNADKRIDTILANADSVTYLISQLGRALDAGA